MKLLLACGLPLSFGVVPALAAEPVSLRILVGQHATSPAPLVGRSGGPRPAGGANRHLHKGGEAPESLAPTELRQQKLLYKTNDAIHVRLR
jgi:hypothetical protein